MTVKEFVDKYKNKELVVKDHITCTYLSFVKKCNLCERIIKATYYIKNDDGTTRLHIDSASKHMLWNLSIVNTYTDIDVDFGNAINEYDLLEEASLFEEISSCMSSGELTKLYEILTMKEHDVIQNEYEPHTFIINQVERFGKLLGISLSPALDKMTDVIEKLDAETIANGLKTLDKMDKSNIVKLFK